jgi:cupin fold WbuC family metalloprotein
MDGIVELNNEVEMNQREILILDKAWVEKIKNMAVRNSSGKYRTCIHQSEKDNVHEMLIVHTSGTYVRPHKHRVNGESLQFIEGEGTAILFNEDGSIRQAFKVGDPSSDYAFYYSMTKELFHMLIINSEFLVFKETTKGPFIRENIIYPTWAPDGNNDEEINEYISSLKSLIPKKSL